MHQSAGEMSPLRRILEQLRVTVTSLADESVSTDVGWAARTSSLPRVWTLNQVRIVNQVDPDQAERLAEDLQGDLVFRHLVVEDDEVGSQIRGPLIERGWTYERELLMAMTVPPPESDDDTSQVVELDEEQMLVLMARWLLEERLEMTAEGLEQVLEYNRREGRLWNETRFGVLDDAGSPVAVTKLRCDSTVAWIEDVYTAPEARGLGFAHSLISVATRMPWRSGRDLTFIIADDNDWPKEFYARAGFEPVGVLHTFHKTVADLH
jgi:GNAT superfamily N-acetyltransferase